ncbi:MAG: aldolase/citrate lyase family protein [Dehalococcoidia bacterium]|nr:aldolase/citrate lyase family protein [Dehalococcoidia bacterium]
MNQNSKFALTLFSTNPTLIRRAVAAGVEGIIVDWEYLGKEDRQACADTQINHDTLDDLRKVRLCTTTTVICRINCFGATTELEVEQAIQAGADEILLPMVETADEVQRVLDLVRGRAGVGVLIETIAALGIVDEIARLPLSQVYVGLNDLAIARKEPNIFVALVDGTVEQIRSQVSLPFGFGGLTLPDRGYPIPCRLLIGEMARLNCDFSFLRRSFTRDIQDREVSVEVHRILEAMTQARTRSLEAIDRDRYDLELAIQRFDPQLLIDPKDELREQ